MQIAYPFEIERTGEVATAEADAHIEQMIEQVLFTNPGECVNRPVFGCGFYGFVREPMRGEMIAVTQALVPGNLLKWLGVRSLLEQMEVEAQENKLVVSIA